MVSGRRNKGCSVMPGLAESGKWDPFEEVGLILTASAHCYLLLIYRPYYSGLTEGPYRYHLTPRVRWCIYAAQSFGRSYIQ